MSSPEYELTAITATQQEASRGSTGDGELRQRKNLDNVESGEPSAPVKGKRKVRNKMYIQRKISEAGRVDSCVDPFTYDIIEEANEKVSFHAFEYVEEILCSFLFPFSILYIWPRYGWLGLQIRSFAAPDESPSPVDKARASNGKKDAAAEPVNEAEGSEADGAVASENDINSIFTDAEKPSYAVNAFSFYLINCAVACVKLSWIGLFIATRTSSLEWNILHVNEGSGVSPVPMYLFCMSSLTFFLNVLSLANKKAFRKKSSQQRLMLHQERRLEELFYGWLPLPWQLVVFELRMAAYLTGKLELSRQRFTFASCTEEQLRAAIGEKVLSYVESNGDRATFSGVSTIAHDDERPAAQCTAMAILVRVALENSFATPAFGPDAQKLYFSATANNWWPLYIFAMAAMPFIVAHGIQGCGTYTGLEIASCILSLCMFFFSGIAPPQGFTISAILTIKRRRKMLSFWNDMLLSSSNQTHFYDDALEGAEFAASASDKWQLNLDMGNASNINLWKKCRDIIIEFGSGFQRRSDANGALMIIYVIIFTLVLVLVSILLPGKVSFTAFAFPIFLHIMLIIPMSCFALALAFEGEKHKQVSDKSASILASAMLHLEEMISRRKSLMSDVETQMITSARNAANHLQISLETSKLLHPTEILNMITLDRALVVSIVFAVFTQFTLILDALNLQSA